MAQIPHITAAPTGGANGVPAHTPRRYVIYASFAPNGVNPISADTFAGDVSMLAAAAWVSSGIYRVTLAYAANAIEVVIPTLQLNAQGARSVQLDAIDLANRTIDFRVFDTASGAPVDVAPDADNRIHFMAAVRGSSRKRF